MRLPLVISLLVHIGIILAGIIVIPRTEEFKVKKTESVPVEVIKLSDITRNKTQSKQKLKPKPPAKKPLPKKAEPKKPKPKPIVKPKPKVKKQVKKKPQKPVKKKPKFNPDRISALLDKTPDKKDSPQNQAKSTLEDIENRVTQDEKDALRAQIERCWSPPPGAANDETGAVAKLQIWLKPDGSLQRDPKVLNSAPGVYFKALSDSATRAVRRCQPFNMPLDKYNNWKEVIINFDPSEMFRN